MRLVWRDCSIRGSSGFVDDSKVSMCWHSNRQGWPSPAREGPELCLWGFGVSWWVVTMVSSGQSGLCGRRPSVVTAHAKRASATATTWGLETDSATEGRRHTHRSMPWWHRQGMHANNRHSTILWALYLQSVVCDSRLVIVICLMFNQWGPDILKRKEIDM